jgi:hypothetical protein
MSSGAPGGLTVMSDREPIHTKNLDIYGHDALDWARVRADLDGPPSADIAAFLGTVRPDGRPHAAGIGPAYLDGDIYITSSPEARKAKNLAANPACTLSLRLPTIDVAIEAEAVRVTDAETLEPLAARYRDGGWPAQVDGDALTAPFSAPSAGPPPWHVYRLVFHTVFGVATTEPHGATRWRFAV